MKRFEDAESVCDGQGIYHSFIMLIYWSLHGRRTGLDTLDIMNRYISFCRTLFVKDTFTVGSCL